jgi:hypothetical protein
MLFDGVCRYGKGFWSHCNLDKESQFIPAVSFSPSVGFLLDQQSFVAACNTWLYASLEKKGHKVCKI